MPASVAAPNSEWLIAPVATSTRYWSWRSSSSSRTPSSPSRWTRTRASSPLSNSSLPIRPSCLEKSAICCPGRSLPANSRTDSAARARCNSPPPKPSCANRPPRVSPAATVALRQPSASPVSARPRASSAASEATSRSARSGAGGNASGWTREGGASRRAMARPGSTPSTVTRMPAALAQASQWRRRHWRSDRAGREDVGRWDGVVSEPGCWSLILSL